MQQARICDDRYDVGGKIEQDIGRGEDERAGLDHRHVAVRYRIDHELADAGIDEHHFNHHDTDYQISEVEGDDGDDRRPGIGQSVTQNDFGARDALELRHLDIGAGEEIDE